MANKADLKTAEVAGGDNMPAATAVREAEELAAPTETCVVLTEASTPPEASEDSSVPFTEDLKTWAASTPEVFNLSVFLTELVGQGLFSIAGPFSYPLLWCLYGSWEALRNRSFFYSTCGRCDMFFVMCLVCWGTSIVALVLWLIYRPKDVMTIELKLVLMSLYFKNVTISVKYAYMAPSRWRQLRAKQSLDFCREGFMIKWFFQMADVVSNETEVALIGVLGTRTQRESLHLKFVGWPSTVGELDALRQRVDKTSRSMYHIPNGGTPKSCVLSRRAATCTDLAERGIAPRLSRKRLPDMDDLSELIFAAASRGEVLPVEEVFHYILRGMLRSEGWLMPKRFLLTGIATSVLFVVFLPSVLRLCAGRGFFGNSWQSTVIILCLWPNALTGHMSTLIFLWTGMKDFWRRWTLMRSCSALLSLDQSFRKGCPPEVQRLPPLDCTDIRTVEAWRKLRSLCRDWGIGYFHRVRGFALVCFVMICLLIGDAVVCMHNQWYREANDFSLADLILAGFMGTLFIAYVIAMVFMGQDINDSAGRHVLLLSRQRLQLTYSRYEKAFAVAGEGEEARDTGRAELLSDYLDAVAADIQAETQVDPVRLLGLYCGYSLLASMYFIPVFVVSSVVSFCASDEGGRCHRLI